MGDVETGMSGRLRLRLFSHDELTLHPGEVGQLLRQPVMMLFYLIGVLALIWMNWDDRKPDMPLELHAAAQVGGVIAGGCVPILWLLWADRRAHRGADILLSASRLFLCAAVLGFAGYNLMAVPMGIAPMPSYAHAAVDIAFNFVLAQIIGGIGVHFVAPAALSDLRQMGAEMVKPVLQDSTPAPQPAPAEIAAAVQPLRPAAIRVANRLFAPDTILRLQAEGTHVILSLPKGQQTLPGPFAAVVAQMPPGLGQQVSRSDWIATAAVREVRRDGREARLCLWDGAEIRVSASRQAKLRDWLDGLMADPQRDAS